MAGVGHNSSGAMLLQFIERVENLETEKKGIMDDIKDVYLEARANGFDVKVMKAVVKRRKQKPDDVREFEAIFETYCAELGIE